MATPLPQPLCKTCGRPLVQCSSKMWTCEAKDPLTGSPCRGMIPAQTVERQRVRYKTARNEGFHSIEAAVTAGVDRSELKPVTEVRI